MKINTCRSCGASIVWLLTGSNRAMPVNADTVAEGDTRYQPQKHVSHFATCPHSQQWRKPKEQAQLF